MRVVHKVVLGIKMTCQTAKNMTLTKSGEITSVVYRKDGRSGGGSTK